MKKNNSQQRKNLLDDRRVLMVLSLLIAFVAWMVVAGFINPGDTQNIFNVAIDYSRDSQVYEEQDLEIVSTSAQYADVRIKGDGSQIAGIDRADVTVYPDYSRVQGPGSYTLPLLTSKLTSESFTINTTTVRTDGHSLDNNPYSYVTVVFEEIGRSQFTVTARAPGVTAGEGFVLRAPKADPETVVISGTKSKVDQISQVVAEVTETEVREESKRYQGVTLRLLDKDGQEIDLEGLTLSPETVDVVVNVAHVRQIELAASFVGFPAGFDEEWFYERVILSSPSVSLVGTDSAFQNISNPYIVGTFDLNQLYLGWQSEPISIDLEEYDLQSYDQLRYVTVGFDSEGLAQKTFDVPSKNIRVVGGSSGVEIEPMVDKVSVQLMGPSAQIAALLPENIVVEVLASDVTAAAGGQQALPARVHVPAASRTFAIGSYTVICQLQTE